MLCPFSFCIAVYGERIEGFNIRSHPFELEMVVRHRELEEVDGELLVDDGVHPNTIGLDIWSLGLRDRIERALDVWRDEHAKGVTHVLSWQVAGGAQGYEQKFKGNWVQIILVWGLVEVTQPIGFIPAGRVPRNSGVTRGVRRERAAPGVTPPQAVA